MTVSTFNRRSFFQKLRSTEEKPLERSTIFGKAKSLLTIGNQELPLVPPPTTTITINGGLEPYAGPWDYEQAAHLLRRTGFGLKKSDLDLLLGMTMEGAVDHVLDVDPTPPAPPVYDYYSGDPNETGDYQEPVLNLGETWVNENFNGDAEGLRIESFRGWWYGLMLNDESSIRERMTLFWHNHFATQTQAVFYGKANYQHNAKLRAGALGNFKELTKTITIDPLMLVFLNGNLNGNDPLAPDENYARELQELFTVGKDNGTTYSEDDVLAAARVLTGWRINNIDTLEVMFYSVLHDQGNKQFSAFYNNNVIAGVPGPNGGDAELDALLDMIFSKNEVAEHICRKLYRWFIYYHIDAATEQNVILPLAQIFRDNNYDIKPVMETLLKSTHFFDALNKGCYIKTPVEIVIGTLRSFNLALPGNSPWDDLILKYYMTYYLIDMQMLPGDPPNVAGWQPYYQVPLYYRMWINGDTARTRNSYTDYLSVFYFGPSDVNNLKIDHIAFASQFSNPSDPVSLIDDMTKLLLPQPISDQKKVQLKTILLSGLPSDSYWTIAWFDYQNDPTDQMSFEVVNLRLTILVKFILNLPEYQLA